MLGYNVNGTILITLEKEKVLPHLMAIDSNVRLSCVL